MSFQMDFLANMTMVSGKHLANTSITFPLDHQLTHTFHII